MNEFFRSFKKNVKATTNLVDKTAAKIRSKGFSIIAKIMRTDVEYVRMQQRMSNAIWGGGVGDGDFKKSKAFGISYKLLKTMEKKVSGSDRKLLTPLVSFRDKLDANANRIKKACVGNSEITDIFNSLIGLWIWLVGMVAASGLRYDSNRRIVWAANKKTMHFIWETNNLEKSTKFAKFVEKRIAEFDKKIVKTNSIDKLLDGEVAHESVLMVAATMIVAPVMIYAIYEFIQFIYFTFRHIRMELSEFIELQSEYLMAESGGADSKTVSTNLANISKTVQNIANAIGEDYDALETKVTKQSEGIRKQIEKEVKTYETAEKEVNDVSASKIEASSNDLLF